MQDIRGTILITMAAMFVGLGLFQTAKHILAPDIGIWTSHAITNVFATLVAGIAAGLVMRRYHGLLRKAADEAERRSVIEAALRASEDRFRTFADFTYDWESWLGPDGRYIYVSPSCQSITGHGPDRFMSDPSLVETIVHPDDLESVREKMEGIGPETGVLQFDFRIVTSDGEERGISHHSQPVFGRDGEWKGRRISHRDISRRMKAIEEQERLIEQLNHALAQVKTLSGLLPICASCKKIRNGQGHWERIEKYISNHSEAEFTHGLCPECKHELYPDIFPKDE